MATFTVAWVPSDKETPTTSEAVLNIGGRIVDTNLSKLDAEKVERCLKINGEGLEGEYITIIRHETEY